MIALAAAGMYVTIFFVICALFIVFYLARDVSWPLVFAALAGIGLGLPYIFHASTAAHPLIQFLLDFLSFYSAFMEWIWTHLRELLILMDAPVAKIEEAFPMGYKVKLNEYQWAITSFSMGLVYMGIFKIIGFRYDKPAPLPAKFQSKLYYIFKGPPSYSFEKNRFVATRCGRMFRNLMYAWLMLFLVNLVMLPFA